MQDTPSPAGNPRVGIVADDLTGAHDCAVMFANRGWSVHLDLGAALRQTTPGMAIATVSDARAMSSSPAYRATGSSVRALRAAGVERLFLKIDSTLRGPILAQVRGATSAWSSAHSPAFAVICPAYPAMGRTVEGGRLLVHGEPVHVTVAGHDPVTPVSESRLSELLDGATTLAAGGAIQIEIEIRAAVAAGVRLVVVDATTTSQLDAIGEAIVRLGTAAIPVGSAGLASAVARAWDVQSSSVPAAVSPPAAVSGRLLVVLSSANPRSWAQCSDLIKSFGDDGARRFDPPAEAFRRRDVDEWMSEQLRGGPALPRVILIAPPSEPVFASARGPGSPSTALVSDGLARGVATIACAVSISALLLIGGDGARAVLGALEVSSLSLHGAVREGVPVGTVEGGRYAGLTVVTKAGGFDSDRAVTSLVRDLLQADPTRDRSTRDAMPP